MYLFFLIGKTSEKSNPENFTPVQLESAWLTDLGWADTESETGIWANKLAFGSGMGRNKDFFWIAAIIHGMIFFL